MGGAYLIPSRLAVLLRSKIYIGKIDFKKENLTYEGKHKGIVPQELFQKVQDILDRNQQNHCQKYEKNSFPLSEKLFDSLGNPLKNHKGTRNQTKKYRYYGVRGDYIPAGDIEEITIKTLRDFLNSPLDEFVEPGSILDFKAVDFDDLSIE